MFLLFFLRSETIRSASDNKLISLQKDLERTKVFINKLKLSITEAIKVFKIL